MTPEDALCDTVRFAAARSGLSEHAPESDPWLVTACVLMAQQACALALRAAGDPIPEQSGATELLLRAATKDRLPAPFTLPFGMAARHSFDRLVEARNSFMHPRGTLWHVSRQTLSRGIPVATRTVRHLMLTQPVLNDLVSPEQQGVLRDGLESIESLAVFLDDPA
jgi:hypothetical protein